MRNMLLGLEVGHEHHPHAHSILSVLGDVDGGLQIVLDLEFVSLGWDDLDDGHLGY